MPFYFDTNEAYDGPATYDAGGPIPGGKKMNAEVAYNVDGLKDREVLQKVQTAHDAVLENAATFTTPNPTLATVQTAHDGAETVLDQIDALDLQRKTLMTQRDAAMATVVQKYKALGAYVENKAAGDPAIITLGGYEVVQPRGATQPLLKVENNVLTSGDNAGEADAAWNSQRGAKSYELQAAADPNGTWTHETTVTVSRAHLTGKPSGQKVWTRVRAINKLGPGPWSDPAFCMVP